MFMMIDSQWLLLEKMFNEFPLLNNSTRIFALRLSISNH